MDEEVRVKDVDVIVVVEGKRELKEDVSMVVPVKGDERCTEVNGPASDEELISVMGDDDSIMLAGDEIAGEREERVEGREERIKVWDDETEVVG